MPNYTEYTVLHVVEVKRCCGKMGRCEITLASNEIYGNFHIFADEHDAARIALHAFPQRENMPEINLWTDLLKDVADTFDAKVAFVEIKQDDERSLYADVTLDAFEKKAKLCFATNVIDGVLLAVALKAKIIIDYVLYFELAGYDISHIRETTITTMSEKQIKQSLEKAIKDENYERASVLRDELIRRKKMRS